MKRIAVICAIVLCAVSCRNNRREALLPSVSGKAGEVLVVIEKSNWEGPLGLEVRELLAADCPFLPIKEPLYSLVNVAPGAFTDLFKVHRNIVIFDINPQVAEPGLKCKSNVWAAPQCVLQVSAQDAETACNIVKEKGSAIIGAIEQAERDRVIANSKRYEEKSIYPQVADVFGGSPHFPSGYRLMKKTDDFIWIQDEKQYTTQGVLIYRYPAMGNDEDFNLGSIIYHRNAILKDNVPGMFENTYMTTGSIPAPYVEYVRFRGRYFAQTRGWWEVENDYMGGPFVSHSFYSRDGKYMIVLDAFVYAPRYDKRIYLRQVESIIYSWDWREDNKG